MFTWLAGMIGDVIRLAANVTDQQKAYLNWRKSDEGQLYHTAEENNAFWKALAAGNTDVIDVGIKDKQDRINALRARTGLTSLLFCLSMCIGCSTYTIPMAPPMLVHEALTSNEVTYVVKDMKAITPTGDKQILEGNWHVVSPDFMKLHVRNQDDLIKALEYVDSEKRQNKFIFWFMLALGFIVVLIAIGRRIFKWNV